MTPPPTPESHLGAFLARSRRYSTCGLYTCAAGWGLALTWAIFTDAHRFGPVRFLLVFALVIVTMVSVAIAWMTSRDIAIRLDQISDEAEEFTTPRNGTRLDLLRPATLR